MDLYNKIAELKANGTPFAVATVAKVAGSAPRHVGAKMIIISGKEIFGTIGGGALENQVITDAIDIIKTKSAELKSYPLGPMLGQCCGGEVEIFFEPSGSQRSVVVFGAGHIAQDLCPMLAKLGFNVTLVDERVERINLPEFGCVHTKLNELPGDAFKKIPFDKDLYVIVITHEHKHDEKIVEHCLERPFKYLGLIGSKTKWAKFRERYKSRGFSEEQLARVTTPIGLDIGSETPFEIAVSIVSQLIQLNAK